MSATYMHIGIPITNKKPGMVYNEGAKFWVSNVDDYDYKIEYLKFEEGTPFPEEIHRNPHVAYKVDRSTATPTWPTRWTIWSTTSPTPTRSSAAPWPPTARATGWPSSGRTGPFWSSTRRLKFPVIRPLRRTNFVPAGRHFVYSGVRGAALSRGMTPA